MNEFILMLLLASPVLGLVVMDFAQGDFFCFLLGGVFAMVLTYPVTFVKNRWARLFIFLILGLIGVLLSHQVYEIYIEPFLVWFQTPMGPPLTIIK